MLLLDLLLLGCVPVIFRDIIAMHRADNKFSIWESQLTKHKAAPSVKRFASDHRRFNFKTIIIHNISREKGIIACMT